MSFRRQLVFSWGIGIPFCIFGLIVLSKLKLLNGVSTRAYTDSAVLGLAEFSLFIGGMLTLFGGVMRPLHRWFWLEGLRNDPKAQKAYLGYAPAIFWRRWLHVDALGNDLDMKVSSYD